MKKGIALTIVIFMLCFLSAQLVNAQLIDYERRSRYQQQQSGSSPATTRTTARTTTSATRSSANQGSETFKVQNRFEKKYDQDRDGQLQEEELKRLFMDVIKEVENDGRAVVMSDVLESYDTNSDGYISRYEVRSLELKVKK